MRNRRLRPPEQTPQGAPCGSLPDLNKLVIPKTNRPSSAKTQVSNHYASKISNKKILIMKFKFFL